MKNVQKVRIIYVPLHRFLETIHYTYLNIWDYYKIDWPNTTDLKNTKH